MKLVSLMVLTESRGGEKASKNVARSAVACPLSSNRQYVQNIIRVTAQYYHDTDM